MLKKINLWYGMPLVLFLCVFVMALSLVHSQTTSPKKSPEELAEVIANAERNRITQLMQPTTQRVRLLSTETLDESFRNLATYDDGQYFEPGYMTNSLTEHPDMQRLLSNRRVLKILQEFEKLPLDQAKTKAKEFHQIAMNNLSKVLHTTLDEYQKEPKQLKSNNDDEHAKFMILTSLLLSASLGDIPLVMQQIDEWGQGPPDVRKRVLNEKNVPQKPIETISLENSFYFDATSFVSILMFAAERKGPLPEIVKKKIAENKVGDNPHLKTTVVPLVSWNAEITYYDARRHHATTSLKKTQTLFTVYNYNTQLRKEGYEFFRSLKEIITSMD